MWPSRALFVCFLCVSALLHGFSRCCVVLVSEHPSFGGICEHMLHRVELHGAEVYVCKDCRGFGYFSMMSILV